MAKKTRQEKELARLRRQLEVLRAQQSSQEYTPPPPSTVPPPAAAEPKAKPLPKSLEKAGIQKVDLKFIKKDLRKTLILSLIALGIIFILYLLRHQIPFF